MSLTFSSFSRFLILWRTVACYLESFSRFSGEEQGIYSSQCNCKESFKLKWLNFPIIKLEESDEIDCGACVTLKIVSIDFHPSIYSAVSSGIDVYTTKTNI